MNYSRSVGSTESERYLAQLSKNSFLSLWSYPEVYRDEGDVQRGGDGKEVCDLLVVFDKHIIIFSDKACEFKDYGDLYLNWKRWYKKAILKSAIQAWGAENWIRKFPTRLFCDRQCTVPFPIDINDIENYNFHCVVVAHNASKPCKEALGGNGSLRIDTEIHDKNHYENSSRHMVKPFSIGKVNTAKNYIHILDDNSLNILLQNLDTATDFIEYLSKKEQVVNQPDLRLIAAGEEDLLAYYLTNINDLEEHDFKFSPNEKTIEIPVGSWERFSGSSSYLNQQRVDQISYGWDRMIEFISNNYQRGKMFFSTDSSFKSIEGALRILAKESRLSRRMLSHSIVEIASKSVDNDYTVRLVFSNLSPGLCYMLFLLDPSLFATMEEYRNHRRKMLEELTIIVKLINYGKMDTIIAIGSEAGGANKMTSYDLNHYDAKRWYEGEKKHAENIYEISPYLKNLSAYSGSVDEYPDIT